jgi:hypothetical protein
MRRGAASLPWPAQGGHVHPAARPPAAPAGPPVAKGSPSSSREGLAGLLALKKR